MSAPTLIYELKVHDDGDIEVRKIPETLVTDSMTFEDTTGLADEIRGYGSRTPEELEEMKSRLAQSDTHEWITV
jgi:hypothetical protein